MPVQPVLDIQQLTVAFSGTEVVRGISFQLHAGETLALVGESGSGKSVTSTAIMGLLPPNGRIVEGRVLHLESGTIWASSDPQNSAPLGRGLSMVFQDPMSSLNPSMRIGWQVAESLRVHGNHSKNSARAAALKLIQEVELPEPEHTFDKYPHELSGGQKQRVMIALSLAAHPEVLIADEPTTALDATVQKSILILLKKLQQQRRLSVLFISHDLDVVRSVADRIAVMQNGNLVEQGTAADILNAPQHPYTQSLIEARSLRQYPSQPTGSVPLISARNLTKSYPMEKDFWGRPRRYFDEVHSIDIDILPGERVGLVGERGSGKSTLGRLLIGMAKPSQGEVIFEGNLLDTEDSGIMRQIRRKAQLVFQDPYSALNPKLTVGSALSEVLVHAGCSSSEVNNKMEGLLAEVGLSPADATKYPGEFSGGQRQRIVIARALAIQPEFVVLDESVAALDLQIQRDILQLLADIGKQRQLTYLFISHDLDVVASFCSRLLIMHRGRIIESGQTEQLLRQPTTEYTAELLASRPGNL